MSAFAKTRCTFCGAHGQSVGVLFHGPNHQAICDRCIRLSAALLDGEPLHDDIPGRLAKWRREAPPTGTIRPSKGASIDGLERADELLCEGYGSIPDPLDPGGFTGGCFTEKVRPAEFRDDRVLDELNVDPGLSVVWPGNGPLQENADHVSERHMFSKLLVKALCKSGRFVGHVANSVRGLRAGLKGRGWVAADRARHSSADSHTGNGGAA